MARLTAPGRFAVKLGLARTEALLAALGSPHAGRQGALIVGTNGKGSTAAFLASILESAGLRTGTTPSPHLTSYTERIQFGGVPISEDGFAAAVESALPAIAEVTRTHGEPTEFEALTAIAIAWLAPRTDRLVIEAGMGGRLDSTNALDLGTVVLTNVALDHMKYLGDTVEAIAAEKAAVIKPRNRVVTGATGGALGVVEAQALAAGARLWRLGPEIEVSARWLGWDGSDIDVRGPGFEHRGLRVRLPGSFQPANAALAVAAAEAMGDATPRAVREGLEQARWPGRLELFPGRPRVVLDGAHNPDALDRLVADVPRLAEGAPVAVVFAAMADKEVEPMLARVRSIAGAGTVFTRAPSAAQRAADPERLAAAYGGRSEVEPDAPAALDRARRLAGPDGIVFVLGSIYLAGDLRPLLL